MKYIFLFFTFIAFNLISQTNSPIGLWKLSYPNGDSSSYIKFNIDGTIEQQYLSNKYNGIWKLKKKGKRVIISNNLGYSSTHYIYPNWSSFEDYNVDFGGFRYHSIDTSFSCYRTQRFPSTFNIDETMLITGKKTAIDKWLLEVDSVLVKGDDLIKFKVENNKDKVIELCKNGEFYYSNIFGYWNANDKYLTLSCFDLNSSDGLISKTWEYICKKDEAIILKDVFF